MRSTSVVMAGTDVTYRTPAITVAINTGYDLYIVATDSAGNDSAVSNVINATSNGMTDPPPTTGTVTAAANGTGTTQSFTFTIADLSEDATIHWAVLADGAPPLSAAALKALAAQNTIPAAGESANAVVAGTNVTYTTPAIMVEINTAYDLYIVATDNGNQDSAVSAEIGVMTNGATSVVPTITMEGLQTGSATTTGFTVEYDLGGTGVTTADVYWAVQLASAPDITNNAAGFTAVRNAIATGDIVAASNARDTAVGTDRTIGITGLPPVSSADVATSGTYEVFIVAETVGGGQSTVVKVADVAITASATFTTAPTATASSSKGGQIDLTYTAASTEQVSYVVLASADPPPTDYATVVAATGVGTNGEDEDEDGTGSAVSIAVTGLAADDYAVYWVIRDATDFESLIIRTPGTGAITTLATPEFTTAPTATAGSGGGEIDLTYTAASTEQVSYVVLANTDTAPADYTELAAATGAGTVNGSGRDTVGTGFNVPITVEGLIPGNEYVVYWIIRTGGVEAPIIRTPDTDAITAPGTPGFTTAPTATPSSSKGGQIDLTYTAESAERVSYVVLASAAPPPTNYDAIVAATGVGTNGERTNVAGTGSAVSIAVTGLAADDYAVYWGIRTGSFESPIIRTPVTAPATPAFTTAPTAIASSSKGGQIDLIYTAASTEQVSYVVLANTNTAPADYTELVAAPGVGTNGSGRDTVGTGFNVPITVEGLIPGNEYVVYWIIRTGGVEAPIIRTPDTGAITAPATPAFTTAPTATTSSMGGAIDLTYTAASTEQVSYVVLASTTAAPADYTELVAATGMGVMNGEATDVAGTGASVSITVSGLTPGDYAVYWVIRDPTTMIESAIIRTPATVPALPPF